jgi:hypothetical protein
MTDKEISLIEHRIFELLKQLKEEPSGARRDDALARLGAYAASGKETKVLGQTCLHLLWMIGNRKGEDRDEAIAYLAFEATSALPEKSRPGVRRVARYCFQWPVMTSLNKGIAPPRKDTIKKLQKLKLGKGLPFAVDESAWKIHDCNMTVIRLVRVFDLVRLGKRHLPGSEPGSIEAKVELVVRKLKPLRPKTFPRWLDLIWDYLRVCEPFTPSFINSFITSDTKKPKQKKTTEIHSNAKQYIYQSLKSLSGAVKIQRDAERVSDALGM